MLRVIFLGTLLFILTDKNDYVIIKTVVVCETIKIVKHLHIEVSDLSILQKLSFRRPNCMTLNDAVEV